MTLTSRLVGIYSRLHSQPFTSYEGLYRRLKQLKDAGLINRRKMLWSGENYFFLTRKGASVIGNVADCSPRCLRPIGETLQRHEYEISRFWLKAFLDGDSLRIRTIQFWRDGEFHLPAPNKRAKSHVADGAVLFDDGDTPRLFILELDRSTMPAGSSRSGSRSFRGKLEAYLNARSAIVRHPDLSLHCIRGFRLIVVCPSEERLENLRTIAEQVGIRSFAAFTCWPRLLTGVPSSARHWSYRNDNLFTAPLFSFPTRSPPSSLM